MVRDRVARKTQWFRGTCTGNVCCWPSALLSRVVCVPLPSSSCSRVSMPLLLLLLLLRRRRTDWLLKIKPVAQCSIIMPPPPSSAYGQRIAKPYTVSRSRVRFPRPSFPKNPNVSRRNRRWSVDKLKTLKYIENGRKKTTKFKMTM